MPAPTPRDLLAHFDRLHLDRFHERAVIQGGKDAKLLAGLCASHGPERVKELMGLFFAMEDEFVLNAGFTVGVFLSQCGKLIARQKATQRLTLVHDWSEECARLHGSRCESRYTHGLKMAQEQAS